MIPGGEPELSAMIYVLLVLVIADKSQFPKSIHEQIDSRARGPDHFCEHPVAHNRNLRSGWAILIQMRKLQQYAREALFCRRSQEVGNVIPVVLDGGQ